MRRDRDALLYRLQNFCVHRRWHWPKKYCEIKNVRRVLQNA
jgi:hypothetical protein